MMENWKVTALRLISLTCIGLALLLPLTGFGAQGDNVQPLPSLAILQQRMKAIQKKTTIPVAIVGKLPKEINLETNKMFSQITVQEDFYGVGITDNIDCDGSEECEPATFLGSLSPIDWHDDEKTFSITLQNGDKAIFHDTDCGASCTGTWLNWKHEKFYYLISLGITEEKTLTDIANSMTYGKLKR
jgi:hypothetical protein